MDLTEAVRLSVPEDDATNCPCLGGNVRCDLIDKELETAIPCALRSDEMLIGTSESELGRLGHLSQHSLWGFL